MYRSALAVVLFSAAAPIAIAADAKDPGTARPPETTVGQDPKLTEPFATKSVTNHPQVIGWPEGKTPIPLAGFRVQAFAGDLKNPRWAYALPDGSVLIAESDTKKPISANRITRLVDADGDGVAETRSVFLDKLNQPLGMLVLGDHFYVANTDSVMRYPYKAGAAKIEGAGTKVLDLPADGYNNHWTRNIVASPDGKKIYVSVGSASNVDEKLDQDAKEPRRAAILQSNPDGSDMKIFAAGLRNPVGMAFEPATGALWTAVNERDHLGDDLVPDYITSVKEGAFYGWPFAYWGTNEDPRHKGARPELVAKSVKPDFALGAHTASLGLTFYTGSVFPEEFRGGAFIGQRGSWNRSEMSGYRVLFVAFKEGKPSGAVRDFLSGFVADAEKKTVYGRPVGVIAMTDGSILVCDDAGNSVWRVSAVASAK
ncbi:PQQ-dependent sugar dehydrogenase [Humisphaera borealis]|uniref:Sorbosone dehydrogenase family protein n=1 Tax=Humisphaera borealis TaxID=2807512 RepID=A0A7M2X1W4_9BACT|nr:sorbosone dehydrogenase family protein [Humisphaera borealis]QOV91747.1 sorbosone dehydrogenase family protein [Humisphaera borealis]